TRKPETLDALYAEFDRAHGLNADFDAHCAHLQHALTDHDNLSCRARRISEDIALALGAAILLRGENPDIGAAFCRARLGRQRALAFGTLPSGIDHARLIDRSAVATAD